MIAAMIAAEIEVVIAAMIAAEIGVVIATEEALLERNLLPTSIFYMCLFSMRKTRFSSLLKQKNF